MEKRWDDWKQKMCSGGRPALEITDRIVVFWKYNWINGKIPLNQQVAGKEAGAEDVSVVLYILQLEDDKSYSLVSKNLVAVLRVECSAIIINILWKTN